MNGQQLADQLSQRWDRMHSDEGEKVDTRTCNRCGEAKPLDDFYKGQGKCKPCFKAHREERAGSTPRKPRIPKADTPDTVAMVMPDASHDWRDAWTNPTLAQLTGLKHALGAPTLDDAAAVSNFIAGA